MSLNERTKQLLGLEKFRVEEEYTCFLPWAGEFGWYVMNHVKRVHGFNHNNKIVCCKKGHECLFPSASHFITNWKDSTPDNHKAGVVPYPKNDQLNLINRIKDSFKDIKFIYPEDTSWEDKASFANFHFVPKPTKNHDLKVDVVLTPRKRELDPLRNYSHWTKLAEGLEKEKLTIGVCGTKESSFDISHATHKSWDYIDIDSDVEMMLNSKIVVSQDSGLSFLAMLCEKPLLILDYAIQPDVTNAHRRKNVFYKEITKAWGDPKIAIEAVKDFLEKET